MRIRPQDELLYILLDAGMASTSEGKYKSLFAFKTFKNTSAPILRAPIHQYISTHDTSLVDNAFWLPNTGNQISHWGKKEEGRKKVDICRYRFFYFDFDLKDSQGQHFKGEQRKMEKEKLLKRICRLPLQPDYIVDSRNGFHLYYTIPDKYSTMGDEKWTHIERGMFKYIYHNISTCIDPAVQKANQLLRFPNSFHHKPEDTDMYKVSIIFMRNAEERQKLCCKDYVPGMFSYSLEEIIEAFQIKQPQPARIVKKQKQAINPKLKSKLNFHKYPAIKAIASHNSDDSCFAPLKQRYGFELTRAEATTWIKSIDLREILLIEAELDKNISSLFYTDAHPSDYFTDFNGRISYYCRAEHYYYNDIFHVILRVMFPETWETILAEDSTKHKEEWKQAYDFAYAMLGIKIKAKTDIAAAKAAFDSARAANIAIFKQIASHSKKTKYLKGLVPIYEHLMDLWKEHSDANNTPWRETSLSIASRFLAKELKTSRPTIRRVILIFEYIGLIEAAGDLNTKWKNVNNYRFNILVGNEASIIERAELIRDKFPKPREQVSRSKLNTLQ